MAALDDRMATRKWVSTPGLVRSPGKYSPSRPITIAFDFDSTLQPYRGRGPSAERTLSILAAIARVANIAIFTNRAAGSFMFVGGQVLAMAPVRSYVARLDELTGPVVTVYASLDRDRFRKPHTGIWEDFVRKSCGGVPPRFAYYCGDAAGRPGDHAASDYAFALNAGIGFLTAEAVFVRACGMWASPASLGCRLAPLPELEKPAVPMDARLRPIADYLDHWSSLDQPAVVIFVGSPGCGKTRLYQALAAKYDLVLVSRDVQRGGHRNVFRQALAERRAGGPHIIVDNTNPLRADRLAYSQEAQDALYDVAICHVATPKAVCFHLNAARCQLGGGPELPAIAIHSFWKRFEPPNAEEAAALKATLITIPFAVEEGAPKEVTQFRYA